MLEKNQMIKNYIIDITTSVNKKYGKIISQEQIEQALQIYSNSNKTYEEIVQEINTKVEQIIINHLYSLKQKEEQEKINNERDSRTFEQIKQVQQKVFNLLAASGIKLYLSGGTVPYLLLNQDSNRMHDDIDTICQLEDMPKLREIFKNYGTYISEWDSTTYAKDEKDYGFEMKIDNVPFGIYPFSYENGKITQYSYDPYNKQCKIKTLQLKELTDYIMTYQSIDNKTYNTMSLEYIKLTKDKAGREKDIQDSKKITETGMLRQPVLDRIEMYQETQKIEADHLESKKEQNHVDKDNKSNSESQEPSHQEINNQGGFDQRSNEEINTANQIRTKNENIKKQKIEQKNLSQEKVKTLVKKPTDKPSSQGFANILILLLIITVVSGIIILSIYKLYN